MLKEADINDLKTNLTLTAKERKAMEWGPKLLTSIVPLTLLS